MKSPLVSIIMPCYNAENYLVKAIESILSQTYANFELLIADDGSADNTKKIIDSFNDPRIKKNHNATNLGNIRTCNKLFELAKGDFIAIQDADDWSSPDRIQDQLRQFALDPDLGACATQCIRTDEWGEVLSISSFPLAYGEIKKGLPESFYFHCTSVMIKREVYENVGGYNLFFGNRGGADWYWCSLIIDKYKFINLNKPHYFYRLNPASITQTGEVSSKLYTNEIIRYLIKQRQTTGSDALEFGNHQDLIELEESFKLDKLFMDKIIIFDYFAAGNFKKAIKVLLRIMLVNPNQPFSFYKNVLYYFKKASGSKLLEII